LHCRAQQESKTGVQHQRVESLYQKNKWKG